MMEKVLYMAKCHGVCSCIYGDRDVKQQTLCPLSGSRERRMFVLSLLYFLFSLKHQSVHWASPAIGVALPEFNEPNLETPSQTCPEVSFHGDSRSHQADSQEPFLNVFYLGWKGAGKLILKSCPLFGGRTVCNRLSPCRSICPMPARQSRWFLKWQPSCFCLSRVCITDVYLGTQNTAA